jgi:hypothetical protein
MSCHAALICPTLNMTARSDGMPDAVSQKRTSPRVALVMGTPDPRTGAPFCTAHASAVAGVAKRALRAIGYSFPP